MFRPDFQRYNDLLKKKKEDMTAEEWEFYKSMYRLEEFQAGLDGREEQ